MNKFTPGPWDTANDGRDVISASTGYIVCETSGNEDDAHLIAAAPEMADELRHICDLLDSAFEQGISIPGLATTNKARALLARVEGK